MNINDRNLDSYLSHKKQGINKSSVQGINFDNMKILTFVSVCHWDKLSLLSMRNNYIKKVDFVSSFPNLFHLDLRDNPIEDYSLFNKYNSFGYLGLSPPDNIFLENQILILKNINVGVLDLHFQNEDNYYKFILNNPNVMLINGNFVLFRNKLHIKEQMKTQSKFVFSFYSTSNNTNSLNNTNSSTLFADSNVIQSKQIEKALEISHHKSLTNQKVYQMIEAIRTYNKKMIENINEENEDKIFEIERSRFILIAEMYQHSLSLQKKSPMYVTSNNNKSKSLATIFDINYFKFEHISLQIPIMCVFYLYLYGVISKGILKSFLLSFYNHKNINNTYSISLTSLSDQIDVFISTKIIFQIAFYYQLYLHLEKLITTNSNINYNKYKSVFSNLCMIPNIQSIKSHLHLSKVLFNATPKINDDICNNKSTFIKENYINYFEHELKIFNNVYYAIQLFIDCIVYNKLEHSLKEEENAYQYQVFLEIKDIMNIHIDKTKLKEISIAESIYNKNNLLNLRNKFFFTKEHSDGYHNEMKLYPCSIKLQKTNHNRSSIMCKNKNNKSIDISNNNSRHNNINLKYSQSQLFLMNSIKLKKQMNTKKEMYLDSIVSTKCKETNESNIILDKQTDYMSSEYKKRKNNCLFRIYKKNDVPKALFRQVDSLRFRKRNHSVLS